MEHLGGAAAEDTLACTLRVQSSGSSLPSADAAVEACPMCLVVVLSE